MRREVSVTEPVTTTMFSPLQMRPRSLLTMVASGFARWMATYSAPFPELIAEHHTAVVVQSLSVDYNQPDLRFEDAAWLTVVTGLTMDDSGERLYLSTAFRAGNRAIAHSLLGLRVLSLAGDESLAARPSALPARLREHFAPEEIVVRSAQSALHPSPPALNCEELISAQEWRTPLLRSHCEVADQWSFIEMIELATCARERLFAVGLSSSPVLRDALGTPFLSLRARFRKPMFVFDECQITTSTKTTPTGGNLVFIHEFKTESATRSHLTVWETLSLGSRNHHEPHYVTADARP